MADLAERIADYLFTSGGGHKEKADILVLTSEDGRDLGGWSYVPFVAAIRQQLADCGLHANCGEPIRHVPFCPVHGEVSNDEIGRGADV